MGDRKVRGELRNDETGDDSKEKGIEKRKWRGESRIGLLTF